MSAFVMDAHADWAPPGLAGPMAIAVSLPVIVSVFGFEPHAQLPVLVLLIGVVKDAAIGTAIGALPGVGLTLAATLGYASGGRMQKRRGGPEFGTGAPEDVAATEAANSAVSGANTIPVLSLGIPGNAAAVFLILAMDSIGGFNPGRSVFRLPANGANAEMVIAFGLFAAMVFANARNWIVGGRIVRLMAVMARVPRPILSP